MDLLHPVRQLTVKEERDAAIFRDWVQFWCRRLGKVGLADTVAGRCQLVLRDELAKEYERGETEEWP